MRVYITRCGFLFLYNYYVYFNECMTQWENTADIPISIGKANNQQRRNYPNIGLDKQIMALYQT